MSAPKKIPLLHVLFSGQGGLGTYFMNFVEADKQGRFEHHAFFYGILPLEPEYRQFCEDRGIAYTYQPHGGKLDRKAYKACHRFAKKYDVSLVLLHTMSLTPFYLRLGRKYQVYAIDHTSHQFKTKVEWVLTALNYRFADRFIYFYQDQLAHARAHLIWPKQPKRPALVPKTVDTASFVPARPPADGVFKLGMTSRLTAGKRHELLIEAMALIEEAEANIYLYLAGEGANKKMLEARAKELGVQDRVHFVGQLNKPGLISFYQSLDAYIHATNSETICYSIMEAQACGLPVLASDVSGVNTVITSGKHGLLFKNEAASVKEAIIKLNESPELKATASRTNRKEAETLDKSGNPVEKIYNLLT